MPVSEEAIKAWIALRRCKANYPSIGCRTIPRSKSADEYFSTREISKFGTVWFVTVGITRLLNFLTSDIINCLGCRYHCAEHLQDIHHGAPAIRMPGVGN